MKDKSHTWLFFSSVTGVEWGGVYFDNGDLKFCSQLRQGKQSETYFNEPIHILFSFEDKLQ